MPFDAERPLARDAGLAVLVRFFVVATEPGYHWLPLVMLNSGAAVAATVRRVSSDRSHPGRDAPVANLIAYLLQRSGGLGVARNPDFPFAYSFVGAREVARELLPGGELGSCEIP